MIEQDAAQIIETELLPGEKLLWADKPRQILTGAYYWAIFFLFSIFLLMGGPVVYALYSGDMTVFDAYNLSVNGERITSETSIDSLWSVLITLVAMMLFMLALGAGWVLLKMREVYGVTDRRAIIVSRFLQRRVASVNPTLTPYLDRSGNQRCGSLSFRGNEHGFPDKRLALYRVRHLSFWNIKNTAKVEALVFQRFINASQKGSSE